VNKKNEELLLSYYKHHPWGILEAMTGVELKRYQRRWLEIQFAMMDKGLFLPKCCFPKYNGKMYAEKQIEELKQILFKNS